MDKLHGKVSMLKQMTGQIHEEATVRGKLIDQLEQTMNNATSALKDAKRRRGRTTDPRVDNSPSLYIEAS